MITPAAPQILRASSLCFFAQCLALALCLSATSPAPSNPVNSESIDVPQFQVASTLTEWAPARLSVRSKLHQLLGNLPPRPSRPRVELISTEDRGDYVFQSLRIDNGAGSQIPAWFLLPKNRQKPVPAILYCHWHGGEYDQGKVELFQSRHTPEQPGPTLAKRGFAVMAIDAYCFGQRNGAGPGGVSDKGSAGEMSASKFNLWHGRTLWGMILRDDLIALDFLCSRPEVDGSRIGVTGMSMGATRSWWLMALDERIKAGVAVACLTRYQNLIAEDGLRYHGIYYFVPGFLNHFDTEAVISLIAPRPLLLMNGDQDKGSPVSGIRQIGEIVKPAYTLYDAETRFVSEVYPGVGHEYLPVMWAKTLEWFGRHLDQP